MFLFPSKTKPTRRPSLSTSGLPEFPPVMSAVQTRFSRVERSSLSRPFSSQGVSLKSPWFPKE